MDNLLLRYLACYEVSINDLSNEVLELKTLAKNNDFWAYINYADMNAGWIESVDKNFYEEKKECFGFDLIKSVYGEGHLSFILDCDNKFLKIFLEKRLLIKASINTFLDDFRKEIAEMFSTSSKKNRLEKACKNDPAVRQGVKAMIRISEVVDSVYNSEGQENESVESRVMQQIIKKALFETDPDVVFNFIKNAEEKGLK